MTDTTYAYVILVRVDSDTLTRYVDSMIDMTEFMGYTHKSWQATQRAKLRLLGTEPRNDKLAAIRPLKLRARSNMADGPLLVKSEVPMTWDDLDTYVAQLDRKDYAAFLKRFRM